MMEKVKAIFTDVGELRTMMVAVAVFSIANIPFVTKDYVRLDDWGILPDVLAPVVGMILFFGLCLDMLMSKVYMSSLEEEGKKRFRTIIRVEAITLFVMVGLWVPYFKRMLF